MRWISVLLFVGPLIASCSHAYYIRSVDSKEYQAFEERASKEECVVSLDDGTHYKARGVELTPEATSWFDFNLGEEMDISTQRVSHIAFIDRSNGVAEGAFFGLALGELVVAALVLTSEGADCTDNSEICFDRGDSFMIGTILVGVPAAVLGAIVGANRGSKFVYYPFPRNSYWEPGERTDSYP